MPTFALDGRDINYGDAGSGRPLVLLHAAGSSGGQWRGMLPRLTARYRVLTPDLHGHGKTPAWPDPEGLRHDHQADLLRALLAEIGADQVDLVGHSYGGATALRFTLAHPATVRRLVVIEPMLVCLLVETGETDVIADMAALGSGFLARLEAEGPDAAWRAFLDFRNGAGTWDGYPENTRQGFLARTPNQIANIHANLENRTTLAELASITTPTLAILSEEVTSFDRRMIEIVAETIPGCASTLLAGTGHMCPITHPDLVADAILAHIA